MNIKDFSMRWALHYVNPDFMKIPLKEGMNIFVYLTGITPVIAYKIYDSNNKLIYSTDYSNDDNIVKYAKTKSINYQEKIDGTIYNKYVSGGYLVEKLPYLDPGKKYKEAYCDKYDNVKGLALPFGTYKIKIAQSPYYVIKQEKIFTITKEDAAAGINEKAIKLIDISDMIEINYNANDYIYIMAKMEFKIENQDEEEYKEFEEEADEETYTIGDPGSIPSELMHVNTWYQKQKQISCRLTYQFYRHYNDNITELLCESTSTYSQEADDEWHDFTSGSQAIYLGNNKWKQKTKGIRYRNKEYKKREWYPFWEYVDGIDNYCLFSYGSVHSRYYGYLVDWRPGIENVEIKKDTFIISLRKIVQDQYYYMQNYIYGIQGANPLTIGTCYHLTENPDYYDGISYLYHMPPEAVRTPIYTVIDGERYLTEIRVQYSREVPHGTSYLPPESMRIPPTDYSYNYSPRSNYISEALNNPPSSWDGAFIGQGNDQYEVAYAKECITMRQPAMTWHDSTYSSGTVYAYGLAKTFSRGTNFMNYFTGEDYIGEIYLGEYEEAAKNSNNWDSNMRCYWSNTQPDMYIIDISDVPEYDPET